MLGVWCIYCVISLGIISLMSLLSIVAVISGFPESRGLPSHLCPDTRSG